MDKNRSPEIPVLVAILSEEGMFLLHLVISAIVKFHLNALFR